MARAASSGWAQENSPESTPARMASSSIFCCASRCAMWRARTSGSMLRISVDATNAWSRRAMWNRARHSTMFSNLVTVWPPASSAAACVCVSISAMAWSTTAARMACFDR